MSSEQINEKNLKIMEQLPQEFINEVKKQQLKDTLFFGGIVTSMICIVGYAVFITL